MRRFLHVRCSTTNAGAFRCAATQPPEPTMAEVMQAIKGLETNMKAEMKALRAEIKEDTHAWFKMNERMMWVSCLVGFVSLGYSFQRYHAVDKEVAVAKEVAA